MDQFKAYYISHNNLDNGWHSFSYKLDHRFFSLFDYNALSDPHFSIVLDIDKSNDSLLLNVTIEGQFKASCDRCLIEVPIDISSVQTQLIKYSDEDLEVEDIIFISPSDHRVNVAKIMFDNILLSLPIINKRSCEEENYKYCDRTILNKIEELTHDDNPNDKSLDEENSTWDALKNLNINN